ncbi:MAG TPA: SDR family oxidoreductase [Gemmatimonadales bacterium]|nr:SDR family oxidoreductase [Gemmatimonadales bacterium]
MSEFAGKAALVTGATSGIGLATAHLLHAGGATVLATGRRRDALDAATGDRWIPLAGDLTDERFRAALVAAAEQQLGRLDVLVNAAGILVGGTWRETDLALWDRMLDINLRAVFDLTRRALPLIAKTKGTVVNVGSVTGTRAFPGVLAYCVSKAALDQLTRCLALELASEGVRVNAVNPGVVRTGLHRSGGMDEASYAAFLERGRATHPLGRVGEPEEVAALIAFLASDRAAWITGETVAIDGGRAQTCAR